MAAGPDDQAPKRSMPKPTPAVLSLSPYVQGKAALKDTANPLKLSSNESMAGPSPKAKAAYAALTQGNTLSLYPEGSQAALRTAIADTFGLDASRIVCGNGSDELIQLVMRAYLSEGDHVVISQYSFGMAYVHAIVQGAKVVTALEPELRPDADQILAWITPHTKMVVLASPNNPVGQYISRSELRRLRAELPNHVVLLCDAAYADYVEAVDFEDGRALVEAGDNTVMTRTFSKLYGLAALRIGWMYAPPGIVDAVNRIRTPFNANGAALAAAEAAVRDQDYAEDIRRTNNHELARIRLAMREIGIGFIPSFANFYLLRFVAEGTSPAGASAHLEVHGIIPRPVNAGGPADCLRLTVGLPEQNDRVIAALRAYMKR